MDLHYEIDQFEEKHIRPVLNLWKMIFMNYSLSSEAIKKHTFHNSDFDPAGCFVAKKDREVIGFLMATVMRIPETSPGDLPGCIPVIMVHPEYQKKGVGRALLKKGEDYLKAQGKNKIKVGYPTYIHESILSFMGVNSEWKEAIWFFKHYGYKVMEIIDSAKVSLENFEIPDFVLKKEKQAAEENIRVGTLTKRDVDRFLEFLKKTFPGWYEKFAYRLPKNQIILDSVLILKQKVEHPCGVEDPFGEEVIGFVGPFDISQAGEAALGIGIGLKAGFRGKGLGNIILYRSLEMVKNKGAKECYLCGVGPKRYYENAGFRLAEMWIIMEKGG